MRFLWAGLGLLGLSAMGLVAACSTPRPAPEGVERRSPETPAGAAELAWSEPIEVARGPARQGAWRMNDSEFHYAEADGGPGGRYQIRYTRRSSGADEFEAPRVISRPDRNGVDSVGFPSLSVDGDGNLYVLWERFPTRRGRPRGLGFAHSADGGRTFGWHAVVPGTADSALGVNGSLQGLLMRKLAVAEDGAIAVVNSSFREDEVSLVRLIRGRFEMAASPPK